MVIDTSAVLAILQDEPDRRAFTERIEAAATRAISAATLVECSIVVESRFGSPGLLTLDRLLEAADVAVVALDAHQARIARAAYRRYGRGRNPAGLNLGDCFSYALAVARAEPLLCKGDDFPETDVELALPAHPA
jgi:ribonuclease VapC